MDLHTVTGSGPGGRIVKADVRGAADRRGTRDHQPRERRPPRDSPDVTTAKGETTIVELTRTQQTIARRMAEAKATIPEFTLQIGDRHGGVRRAARRAEVALRPGRRARHTTTWS